MFKEDISTRVFVKSNKELFEDVAKEYSNIKYSDDVEYTMLDYEKILNEMCEFITGYIQYKDAGEDKYKGKVLSVTLNFYNRIFIDDKKYRNTVVLHNIRTIIKQYLILTKKLTGIMDDLIDRSNVDNELFQLLKLSDNQYKKISKVFKDDMEIYRWLNTSNSKVFNHTIPMSLEMAFKNNNTPVMHRK